MNARHKHEAKLYTPNVSCIPSSFPKINLVLLPGMDGTGLLFEPLVAALDDEFTIQIIDYPIDQALGYDALENFVRERLPQNEPYFILGESFSGPIAMSIAASRPPLLKGVILCATFARNPRPVFGLFQNFVGAAPVSIMPTRALGVALLGSFATPARLAALASALARVAPAVLHARVREVLAVDVTEKLSAIDTPILYLQAARDRVVPSSAAALIASHVPHMRVEVFDAPHFLFQCQPAQSAQLILRFVKSLGEL